MSTKKLRKLTRRLPTPVEFRTALEFGHGASDRVVAIVTGAVAERMLEQLLATGLPNLSDDLRERVFSDRGPLSDFNGKILMARAMGLIDDRLFTELNFVRQIRNVFAHAPFEVTFDTEEIAVVVRANPWAKALAELKLPDNAKLADLNKTAFSMAGHGACMQLSIAYKERVGTPLLVLR